MLVKCDQCGKEFNKWPCLIKRHKQHFCCKKCYTTKMKGVPNVKCYHCGALFHKHACLLGRSTKHFCSIECAFPIITVCCNNCGKNFREKPGRAKRGHHFCSLNCRNEYMHKNALRTIQCPQCSIVFTAKSRAKQTFCSPSCVRKFKSMVCHIKKLGNFTDSKEVTISLIKVKLMSHQEAQTTIKATPR